MVTMEKYPTAQKRGQTCGVNLGIIHLEMKKLDKTKFHRKNTKAEKKPSDKSLGTPTTGSQVLAASRRTRERWRGKGEGGNQRGSIPRNKAGQTFGMEILPHGIKWRRANLPRKQ
jgi:hypothetical protein